MCPSSSNSNVKLNTSILAISGCHDNYNMAMSVKYYCEITLSKKKKKETCSKDTKDEISCGQRAENGLDWDKPVNAEAVKMDLN